MSNCPNCSSRLKSGWRFCDECGMMNDSKGNCTECELHTNSNIVGFCVVCSKPVCEQCMVKYNGKIFCTDSSHLLMFNDWTIVCRPESQFEADAVVCNLKAGGIDSKTFSLHDHISARDMNENRVLVFAGKIEAEKAKILLLNLNLV